MNQTVTETGASRPVWEVLQAVSRKLYNPALCAPSSTSGSLCRTPNASEVRSMTWQAIAAGANGIFYWEFNDLFRNPDVGFNASFEYYNRTATEVLQFAPLLLLGYGKAPPPAVGAARAWLVTRTQWAEYLESGEDAVHDAGIDAEKDTKSFLNRLLGVTVQMQNLMFSHFAAVR